MNETANDAPAGAVPGAAPPAVPERSALLVHLLKGVLHRDDDERL